MFVGTVPSPVLLPEEEELVLTFAFAPIRDHNPVDKAGDMVTCSR